MATWLAKTGQRWKVWVGWLAGGASLALFVMFATSLDGEATALPAFGYLAVSMAIGASSFAWLCMAVRCRQCGGHPTWWLMRNADASVWFRVLIACDACPICHDESDNEEWRRV